jgi:hypothetical protein
MSTYKKIFVILSLILVSCSWMPKSRSFHINYSVDILPTEAKEIKLWLPIPQSDNVQEISNMRIDFTGKYEIKTERIHNNKYLFTKLQGPIKQKIPISIGFSVKRNRRADIQNDNSDSELYLKANLSVPVGGRFAEILQNENITGNDIETVGKIYDYILDSMEYGKPKKANDNYAQKFPKAYEKYLAGEGWGRGDSDYACDIGVGNCTDYHSLFNSLVRTNKVPARFKIGFPVPENTSGEIKGYHCWTEFLFENEGWIPVDISEADKHPELRDFYFGNLDENRITISKGRDLMLEECSKNPINFFVYPILEEDKVITDNYIKKVTFSDK